MKTFFSCWANSCYGGSAWALEFNSGGSDVADANRPNILVIWGDDIGITNLSCYSSGLMGYRTPNIDRIADEGMRFTDSYGEQSCTAGRSSFITGQSVYRTGLSKVGVPAADIGLQAGDPTIADLLRPLGYATGQLGKNHAGERGPGRAVAVPLPRHDDRSRQARRRAA